MRPYEVMIVLNPTLEEEAVRAEVDKATALIKARGGTPGRVDRWGKRRLAYEIEDHREGYYVVIDASAEPATMADLDRALHLADGVMRHKVMRIPDHVAGQSTRRSARPEEAAAAPASLASTTPDKPASAASPGTAAAASTSND